MSSLRQVRKDSDKPRGNGVTGADTEWLVYTCGVGPAREAFASAEFGWRHISTTHRFLLTVNVEISALPALVEQLTETGITWTQHEIEYLLGSSGCHSFVSLDGYRQIPLLVCKASMAYTQLTKSAVIDLCPMGVLASDEVLRPKP